MHGLALVYLKIKDLKRHLRYYKTNITHLFYSKPSVNGMTVRPADQEKVARQQKDETSQMGNLNDNCYLGQSTIKIYFLEFPAVLPYSDRISIAFSTANFNLLVHS